MSRSIQLVLLCVVTLSYIQLGRAQNDAHNVSEAVLEELLLIVKEIKKDINSVKGELTSLNETVSHLSGDLEQHKKGVESTSDLMRGDLKSVKRKLNRLDESVSHLGGDLEQHKNQTTSVLADLQSSINKSHTEQLNLIHDEMESVLTEKLTHIEDRLVNQLDDLDLKLLLGSTTSELMRGDLSSMKRKLNRLDESVSHLSGDLEQHKTQTASVLADLQSLDSQLAAVNTSMTEDITSLKNQLNAKLNEQTESITADLQSFINMSHTELLNLIHDDVEFELMMYNKTCVEDKLESEINSEIQQNRTHQVNNSDENTPPLPIHTCDDTGGWRRAVYLDMTDPNTTCPEEWSETGYSKRTCGRTTDDRRACDSVTFPVSGGEYSQVCGRIRA